MSNDPFDYSMWHWLLRFQIILGVACFALGCAGFIKASDEIERVSAMHQTALVLLYSSCLVGGGFLALLSVLNLVFR